LQKRDWLINVIVRRVRPLETALTSDHGLDLTPKNWSKFNVRLWARRKGGLVGKRAYTPEQIIRKLREAELLLSQGDTVAQASKKIGVSEHTYYRWRREYGGMRVKQVKRLKELEKENSRLKKLVAELSLDVSILEEAARGNS
jgi:transposase-like protein